MIDRDLLQQVEQEAGTAKLARKRWTTPRIILEDTRNARGGTEVTTIDFVHPPITSSAS